MHVVCWCGGGAPVATVSEGDTTCAAPSREDAPLLSLLVSVWSCLERWPAAAFACRLLLGVRVASAAHPVDLSLLSTQLARLALTAGDAATVDIAVASAREAAAAASTQASTGALKPEAVPAPLNQGASLRHLVLARQGLSSLPVAVGSLSSLVVLDASHNTLTELPVALENLSSLQELLLACNDLSSVPLWLSNLPQLLVLNLQSNRLTEAPPAALRCPRLRNFRWGQQKPPLASSSPSLALPAASPPLARFSSASLAVLELEANGQSTLADLNPQNTVLTALLASFNQLNTVPAQLSRYGSSLKRLHLGGNDIASLAGALAPLTSLAGLMVEDNRLTALPEDIGCLTELRELSVYGNLLETLPDAIGRCASLTKLEANHNKLADLPTSMSTLGKLKSLYLQSNRLVGSIGALHAKVLKHLPLLNIGLGANLLELSTAFELPGVRLGLGWNVGSPPPSLQRALTDRFATVDHLFDPLCRGCRGDVLLVAFAAQGPGMQQWVAPCSATRAAGVALDALYLADPSNSYYLQDPSGGWGGIAHYAALIRAHTAHYTRVLMIGSSMGGTAALVHSSLAHRVLAFGPKVALEACHGSFLPIRPRKACSHAVQAAALGETGCSISVHVGSGNLEDLLQAARLRVSSACAQNAKAPSHRRCAIIEHDTFHHNIPMYLEREGLLVSLFKQECEELLRPPQVAAALSAWASPAEA